MAKYLLIIALLNIACCLCEIPPSSHKMVILTCVGNADIGALVELNDYLATYYPHIEVFNRYYWKKHCMVGCSILLFLSIFIMISIFTRYNLFRHSGIPLLARSFFGWRPRGRTLFLVNKIGCLITSVILFFFVGWGHPNESGAFEITINNKLIWSKLRTGKLPDLNALPKLIADAVPTYFEGYDFHDGRKKS